MWIVKCLVLCLGCALYSAAVLGLLYLCWRMYRRLKDRDKE